MKPNLVHNIPIITAYILQTHFLYPIILIALAKANSGVKEHIKTKLNTNKASEKCAISS